PVDAAEMGLGGDNAFKTGHEVRCGLRVHIRNAPLLTIAAVSGDGLTGNFRVDSVRIEVTGLYDN
ncbi:MAG TPA: hypothetical protein VF707_15035, partial [Ardenticatenaceae bacterium]